MWQKQQQQKQIQSRLKMKRQIKKSVIVEIDNKQKLPKREEVRRQNSRERSRERNKQQKIRLAEVEEVSAVNRRELLRRMREREEQEGEFNNFVDQNKEQKHLNIKGAENEINSNKHNNITSQTIKQQPKQQSRFVHQPNKPQQPPNQGFQEQSSVQQQQIILHKPVYVGKQQRETLRNQTLAQQKLLQEQSRKVRIQRSNAKLLLNQTLKTQLQQQNNVSDSDSDKNQMPDDNDLKDENLEYELWKIRQLKRIKRDNEQRNALVIKQADIQRRRKMTDQQRLLQNKKLGSDLTDKTQSTKYVYMQKYYHRGAFFQDSQQSVMKKDYNLPTAMELQDKTMLPKILQKRKNDFGKKGQSKHTHLADVDTTNFDPKTKANETVMIAMQRKMAGYKDSFLQGKR